MAIIIKLLTVSICNGYYYQIEYSIRTSEQIE